MQWIGQFDDEHAFSKLNRNIVSKLNVDSNLTVVSQYPYIPPPVTPAVLVMTWEFGGNKSVPPIWVNFANQYQATLAMSDWVGRVLYLNGIQNLATFHLGVDETLYYPRTKHTDKFRVLLFGGSDPRHGVADGIKAFQKAFGTSPNAELVIKNSYGYPAPKVPAAPNISLLNTTIPEADLPEFYAEFSCLLLPLRGAGPGLIGMEAMACGLPVIVAQGSGMREYAKYCYPVNFTIERTTHHCVPAPEPYWIVPSVDEMAQQLLNIYNWPEAAAAVGQEASEYIRNNWTWAHTAEQLARIITAIDRGIEVSIVILVGPRKEAMLSRCVDSIIQHTKNIGFELVIIDQNLYDWEYCVDNGLKHPYNQVIRLDKNVGVAAGRNIGLKAARGKYTLFLDDDAYIISDTWLEQLLAYFKDTNVGIVGQTGYFVSPKTGWGNFMEAPPGRSDVVQGYCQLFPTQLRDKISLDTGYGMFWHEDSDWCLQIKELGYAVITSGDVGIVHLGSMSCGVADYGKAAARLKSKWEHKLHLLEEYRK